MDWTGLGCWTGLLDWTGLDCTRLHGCRRPLRFASGSLDGALQILTTAGGAITTLGAQSFFGEMALLNPTGEATASVVVRTYLEGYLLTKESFTRLESHHPVFRDYIESAARLRLQAQRRQGSKMNHNSAALYDVLDPMKRRLVRKHQRDHNKSLLLDAAGRTQQVADRRRMLQRCGTARGPLTEESATRHGQAPRGGKSHWARQVGALRASHKWKAVVSRSCQHDPVAV